MDAVTGEPTEPGDADPDAREYVLSSEDGVLLRNSVSTTHTLYRDIESGVTAVSDADGDDPVDIEADEYATLCGHLVYARTGLDVTIDDVAGGEPERVTTVRLPEEPVQTLFSVGNGYASFTVGSGTMVLSDRPLDG